MRDKRNVVGQAPSILSFPRQFQIPGSFTGTTIIFLLNGIPLLQLWKIGREISWLLSASSVDRTRKRLRDVTRVAAT